MIKKYKFEYDEGRAEVSFEILPSAFTKEKANEVLSFFGCEAEYPIDEVLKMYAIETLTVAKRLVFTHNEAVVENFNRTVEGYYPLNKGFGIRLLHIDSLEIDEDLLKKV